MDKITITINYVGGNARVECPIAELTIPSHFLWMWNALMTCMITAVAKNHDYSQGEKWYHNFSGGGLKGIMNRMQDKYMRLVNQVRGNAAEVKDESFDDTCLDLATYCLLLYGARKEGVSVEGDLWNTHPEEPRQ